MSVAPNRKNSKLEPINEDAADLAEGSDGEIMDGEEPVELVTMNRM